MNNFIALLIKLLLFTVILAVYQLCICIYFNDNIVFLSISFLLTVNLMLFMC